MDFTSSLLHWFRENGRALPWRETNDPYPIWLSEIILQQTRTEQGRPYWERFMQRWPTVELLAAATEDEVLREWQGLGYYSRARNLHYAAKQIVAAGGFPSTYEGIRRLKGVGDYTAAAIGSFAFGLPVAVVDGNVYRVLSRYFGIDTPINTTEGKKVFAALAQSLLPGVNINKDANVNAEYNQAIMDFGATQCMPASAHCDSCPLMESCTAFREHLIGMLPVKLKKTKVQERHIIYIYVKWQGMTALRRRPAGDIWQGLYEPLQASPLGGESSTCCKAEELFPPRGEAILMREHVKHVLTHRIIYADFWLWEPHEQPPLPDGYFWVSESDIDRFALPRLVELLFDMIH